MAGWRTYAPASSGPQVGTYDPDEPNKMRVGMTYLVPDAEHPFGQAFDGAGNPTPLHL